MAEKQKWDRDRGEWYPPQIIEPYSIARRDYGYMLLKGELMIQRLKSQSEHGAIREGNAIIKTLDF